MKLKQQKNTGNLKKGSEGSRESKCWETETCLQLNNSKRAYQLVNDLTSEK